jgi:type IV secretory pathway TrbD component
MQIALIILIGIHGVIHLFGFLSVFEISGFNNISPIISKTIGLVWLVTFFLFLLTVLLLVLKSRYWWISGLLAVFVSQILIFRYWSDAKFGTIINLVILIAVIMAYADYNFEQKIIKERKKLFKNSKSVSEKIITKETISDLPLIIQKWLMNNGTVGKNPISNVHLTQNLQLKLSPDQKSWSKGKAEQYFTINPPAFSWNINTNMKSILSIVGRDKFENGNGEMIIKLLTLIPVANTKNSYKIDEATLQRYLAEIVWFPSASLSPHIKWESLDNLSAKATMTYNGVKGSGKFYFDEKGNFKKFVAMRFQNADAIEPSEWTIKATQTDERNGINIPIECEASWQLNNGQWTWLKVIITNIKYNVKEIPNN